MEEAGESAVAATISILAFLAAVLLAAGAGWQLLCRAGPRAKRLALYALLAFILSVTTACGAPGGGQAPPQGSPSPGAAATSPPAQEKPPGVTSQPGAPGKLTAHYLDVGQGDAILVQLPDGQNILVDAGSNDAGPRVVQQLQQYGVGKLDFVIGTHPHEDHIGGLDVVINSFPVGKVYLPRVTHNTDSYRDLLLAIKNKGLRATEAKAGVTLPLAENSRAVFVSPAQNSYEDLNDYSAVLYLTYGKTAFLFTGDAGTAAEKEMLATRQALKADVLKVAHHGSRSSTGAAFLKAVAPAYAVISVGKDNDYGHPHTQTLQRLQKAGVKIYRTDHEGTITAVSDGQKVTVE